MTSPTSSEWVDVVLSDLNAFLLDHANCERKASALAMSLVVKYPDRRRIVSGLIDLAQEELQHFRQMYDVLEKRGLTLVRDEPDPYVNELLAVGRHGRDERFIDRMLVSSVVECRGAERFGLLAAARNGGSSRAAASVSSSSNSATLPSTSPETSIVASPTSILEARIST